MGFKLAYFIKLFLIVALSTVVLASVGTAPDRPLLFLAVLAAGGTLIRFLWRSALKDEKMLGGWKIPLQGRRGNAPPDLKRAA